MFVNKIKNGGMRTQPLVVNCSFKYTFTNIVDNLILFFLYLKTTRINYENFKVRCILSLYKVFLF